MMPLAPGTAFPPFVLPSLGGKLVSLSEFTGKRVVLACWASYDPCREDLPDWQAFARRGFKRPGEILTVAIDIAGAGPPMKVLRRLGVTLPCLVDSMALLPRLAGFRELPRTFAIDETGHLRLAGGRPEPAFLRNLEIFLNGRGDPFEVPPVAVEGDPRHGHDTALDRMVQEATNFIYKNRPADAIAALRRAVAAAPDHEILRRQLLALEQGEPPGTA